MQFIPASELLFILERSGAVHERYSPAGRFPHASRPLPTLGIVVRRGRRDACNGCRRRRGYPARLQAKGSEEHTSELQSLMRISYAVFCLKKKTNIQHTKLTTNYL